MLISLKTNLPPKKVKQEKNPMIFELKTMVQKVFFLSFLISWYIMIRIQITLIAAKKVRKI